MSGKQIDPAYIDAIVNDIDSYLDHICSSKSKSFPQFNFDFSKIRVNMHSADTDMQIQPTTSVPPTDKSVLKSKLKKEVKKKFKRNSLICLRTKSKGGLRKIDRIFHIKQVVWSIGQTVIKALVVKQISGPNYNMFSLNQYDCERLHVKYEPGLQFLSMELPWIPVKESMIPEQYKQK